MPKDYNARTAVHEYGGAAFAVRPDGTLVFSDWETSGAFILDPAKGGVEAITEPDHKLRFASFSVHPTSPNWILAIQENHHAAVENTLVAIDATNKTLHSIAQGADFYNHPQFSPQGDKLCWIQWDHPDMPWTGTTLFLAEWKNGEIGSPQRIAGHPGSESIVQPQWTPDGSLLFSSDFSGYWKLYCLKENASEPKLLQLKDLEEAEFAGVEFILGRYGLALRFLKRSDSSSCTHIALSAHVILAAYQRKATSHLIMIDLEEESWSDPGFLFVDVKKVARISDTSFALIGATSHSPMALYRLSTNSDFPQQILRSSADFGIANSLFSSSQHISFPRTFGNYKIGDSHAILSPPHNPEYRAPEGTLPPLVMWLHGGPTGHDNPSLSMATQYWTSRGYAFVSVNYAGSTGYGKSYRDLLNGNWGVLDVADAASCVAYLSNTLKVDPSRVGIQGGSSGGYGVLQALCDYPRIWAAGISLYGISSLKALIKDTHKYESHYMDRLLFHSGASPEEQERILYDRTPFFHASNITAPVLLLQGSEDKVVPPNQTRDMEREILDHGGEVRVVIFEGEGHGFRQKQNLKKSLEEEEKWFRTTLVRE